MAKSQCVFVLSCILDQTWNIDTIYRTFHAYIQDLRDFHLFLHLNTLLGCQLTAAMKRWKIMGYIGRKETDYIVSNRLYSLQHSTKRDYKKYFNYKFNSYKIIISNIFFVFHVLLFLFLRNLFFEHNCNIVIFIALCHLNGAAKCSQKFHYHEIVVCFSLDLFY